MERTISRIRGAKRLPSCFLLFTPIHTSFYTPLYNPLTYPLLYRPCSGWYKWGSKAKCTLTGGHLAKIANENKPWFALFLSDLLPRWQSRILLIGPSTCQLELHGWWRFDLVGISLIARDQPLIGISGVPYTVPPKSLTTLIPQQKRFLGLQERILSVCPFNFQLKGPEWLSILCPNDKAGQFLLWTKSKNHILPH